MDSSPGIYDSRDLNSYRKSTVDQKIPFGARDFSLDSLRSNVHSLYGDCGSGFDRIIYFRKIECNFISGFDFCYTCCRIFTFLYSRIFGEGERYFKGYYTSYSAYLSIFLLVVTDLVFVHGFFTFDQRLEPSQFPSRAVSIFLLNDFVAVFHWKEFIPYLILFPLIGILSRSKFHSVILDHL